MSDFSSNCFWTPKKCIKRKEETGYWFIVSLHNLKRDSYLKGKRKQRRGLLPALVFIKKAIGERLINDVNCL